MSSKLKPKKSKNNNKVRLFSKFLSISFVNGIYALLIKSIF